jgi:hypothetical protein
MNKLEYTKQNRKLKMNMICRKLSKIKSNMVWNFRQSVCIWDIDKNQTDGADRILSEKYLIPEQFSYADALVSDSHTQKKISNMAHERVLT